MLWDLENEINFHILGGVMSTDIDFEVRYLSKKEPLRDKLARDRDSDEVLMFVTSFRDITD